MCPCLEEVNKVIRQERKSWNSKHLIYSKLTGFGPATYCFNKIAFDYTRSLVRFQAISLFKNH